MSPTIIHIYECCQILEVARAEYLTFRGIPLVDSEQIKLNRTLGNHKNALQQLYTSTHEQTKILQMNTQCQHWG